MTHISYYKTEVEIETFTWMSFFSIKDELKIVEKD